MLFLQLKTSISYFVDKPEMLCDSFVFVLLVHLLFLDELDLFLDDLIFFLLSIQELLEKIFCLFLDIDAHLSQSFFELHLLLTNHLELFELQLFLLLFLLLLLLNQLLLLPLLLQLLQFYLLLPVLNLFPYLKLPQIFLLLDVLNKSFIMILVDEVLDGVAQFFLLPFFDLDSVEEKLDVLGVLEVTSLASWGNGFSFLFELVVIPYGFEVEDIVVERSRNGIRDMCFGIVRGMDGYSSILVEGVTLIRVIIVNLLRGIEFAPRKELVFSLDVKLLMEIFGVDEIDRALLELLFFLNRLLLIVFFTGHFGFAIEVSFDLGVRFDLHQLAIVFDGVRS